MFMQIDPKPCNPRAEMVRAPRRSMGTGNGYKVFLGGLPSNLTETDLRNFFSQYGKVSEVVIMYDQEKKKSRGESLSSISGY
jgi:RNA-binding protein Musashi